MGALQRMLPGRKPSYHANGDTAAPLAMVAGGAGTEKKPRSHILLNVGFGLGELYGNGIYRSDVRLRVKSDDRARTPSCTPRRFLLNE